jgi:hypothetical protein
MVRDYVLPHCYHGDAITYLVHHNYDNHTITVHYLGICRLTRVLLPSVDAALRSFLKYARLLYHLVLRFL